MGIFWTNEVVLKLIDLYRSHHVLWDNSHHYYKNKNKRTEAWESIASKINSNRKECEIKIHNIRSQFNREKKRIAEMRVRGADYESTWFAFDSLHFLLKETIPDSTSRSTDTTNEQTSDSFTVEEDTLEELRVQSPSESPTPQIPSPASPISPPLVSPLQPQSEPSPRPLVTEPPSLPASHLRPQPAASPPPQAVTLVVMEDSHLPSLLELYPLATPVSHLPAPVALHHQPIPSSHPLPPLATDSHPTPVSHHSPPLVSQALMTPVSHPSQPQLASPAVPTPVSHPPSLSLLYTPPPQAIYPPPVMSLPSSPPPPFDNNQKKRKKYDLSEAYEIIKSLKEEVGQPKDEFQIYADYVASELRHVNNKQGVLHAKYFINNILIDARLGKFNEPVTN